MKVNAAMMRVALSNLYVIDDRPSNSRHPTPSVNKDSAQQTMAWPRVRNVTVNINRVQLSGEADKETVVGVTGGDRREN